MLNTVQVTTMLDNEDLTTILLAQHGDEASMEALVRKYQVVIRSAAQQYADTYGYDDCYGEAVCSFIECVHNADPSDIVKFRASVRKELVNGIVSRLNPYGLSRRHLDRVSGEVYQIEYTERVVEPMARNRKPKWVSKQTDLIMRSVLDVEEFSAVEAWLEYQLMSEADIAEEIGMTRDTYRRRLATAFAKLREHISDPREITNV